MAQTNGAHAWFSDARFGLFIHWGPYSQYGRGEQVLFRDHIDQTEYANQACAWKPAGFDAAEWARHAVEGGFRYAVLTSRHHDGFCLWDSKVTDYTAPAQSAGRDFVGEYVAAFRDAGLKVGLYYSLADWRIPAYWDGPEKDPEGWAVFREYVFAQVRELLTNYGKIDVIWFDGAWPRGAEDWGSTDLIRLIRSLQPEIMINNRLDFEEAANPQQEEAAGASDALGDFGTPEHHITGGRDRPWESCQVSTWRLWGHTFGERWRGADYLLDMLVEATSKGGNLLLNVGPDAEGRFPAEFVERFRAIGEWLAVHGECIYGPNQGEVCEFIGYGRQIAKGNDLYLVIRFWDGRTTVRLAGLETVVERAILLTTGESLTFTQTGDVITIGGLPEEPPTPLFPVIKLACASPPKASPWAVERLWFGDPSRMTPWATARGTSVWRDGQPR